MKANDRSSSCRTSINSIVLSCGSRGKWPQCNALNLRCRKFGLRQWSVEWWEEAAPMGPDRVLVFYSVMIGSKRRNLVRWPIKASLWYKFSQHEINTPAKDGRRGFKPVVTEPLWMRVSFSKLRHVATLKLKPTVHVAQTGSTMILNTRN